MGIYDTYNFGTGSWNSGGAGNVTGGFILGGDGSNIDAGIFNGSYVSDLIGSFDSDPIFNFDLGGKFTSGDDPLSTLYSSIIDFSTADGRQFDDSPGLINSASNNGVSDMTGFRTGDDTFGSARNTTGVPSIVEDATKNTGGKEPPEEKSWWDRQNGQAQSAVITGLFNAAGGFFKGVADAKARKDAARQSDKNYKRSRDDKLADDERTRQQLIEDRNALWARQDLTEAQKFEREKQLLQMRLDNDINVSNIRNSSNGKTQGGASTFNPGLIRKG